MARSLQVKLESLVVWTVRLAAMERFATKLGRMAFIWATAVLLGGFVSGLSSKEFRIISVLLLTEGARVFFNSHELKLKKRSLNIRDSFARIRKLVCSTCSWLGGGQQAASDTKQKNEDQFYLTNIDVKTIPFIPTQLVDFLLYALQLGSAAVSFSFAVYRLSRRYLSDQQNNVDAVKAFYALVVIETSIFMFVRAQWEVYVPRLVHSCKSELRAKLKPQQCQGTMLKKFVEAISTDSMQGMHRDKDFNHYVAEKLPLLKNHAEQQESLLLLRKLCSPEAMVRIATRDFISCLFNLMSMKYPQETREQAILLVKDLACTVQDKEVLSTIRLIVSDKQRVAVIIKALHPKVSTDVLILLGKIAEGSVEDGALQVKLEVSKHGFEFLMKVMRGSSSADHAQLAKKGLVGLYWNWKDLTILQDIGKLFNTFLVDGLLMSGEVLCQISGFAWHKEMLQILLLDGERIQMLLKFVLDVRKGYYSMRILNNVCAGGKHYPTLGKIWQEKLVGIVELLPYIQDRRTLFMAMTLFTSVVDFVGVPAASFTQETKTRLIEKLLSTCNEETELLDQVIEAEPEILKEIGQQTNNHFMKSGAEAAKNGIQIKEIEQQTIMKPGAKAAKQKFKRFEVMKSGAEEARQEPVTLEDAMRAVDPPGAKLFLFTLVQFCEKLLKIDASSFAPLEEDHKLRDYIWSIHNRPAYDLLIRSS